MLDVATWGNTVTMTSFAMSMAVNTLVTGLIVFKILRVLLEVRTTSVERTISLGSSCPSRGTKLQHVLFVIVESGMVLFAIQLIRVVFVNLPLAASDTYGNIVAGIHQMFNVIMRFVHLYFFFFTDNIYLDRVSHQQ